MTVMRTELATLSTTIALVVSFASAAPIYAQPKGKDKEAVVYFYEQGKTLLDAGKTAEACVAFEKAKALDQSTINLRLRLADCYEKLGRTATAHAELLAVASLAATARDPREATARDRARAMEPSLARLVIHLPPLSDARGLEVRLAGNALARASFGKTEPIDPGSYKVEASAPGKKSWSATYEVKAGARVDVTIPVLDDLVVKPHDDSPPPAPRPDTGRTARRAAGIALAGLGAVGLGIGVGFGVKAIRDNDASNDGCNGNNVCSDPSFDLRQSARRAGDVSTAGFVAGAVLATAGIVLIAWPSRGEPVRTGVSFAPHGGFGSLVVSGRF